MKKKRTVSPKLYHGEASPRPESVPSVALRPDLATPLRVCFVNRVALFFLAYAALVAIPYNPLYPPTYPWRPFPNNLLFDGWARWDSGWYWTITMNGYSNIVHTKDEEGARDTAFFPLYPLVVRSLSPSREYTIPCGIILSNLAFCAALYLMYRLVFFQFGAATAEKSIILLSVFPFSLFFSAYYPESIYLLAIIASFYSAYRQKWLTAGICAALAGLARFPGILMVPALLVLYLEQIDFKLARIRWNILGVVIGGLGITTWCAYLGFKFGDPWIPIRPSGAKGWAGSFGWAEFVKRFAFIRFPDRILTGQYRIVDVISILLIPVAFVLVILTFKYLSKGMAVWVALNWMAAARGWIGFGRYMSVLFPLFIVLAILIKKESIFRLYLYVSALFLALLVMAFGQYAWIG